MKKGDVYLITDQPDRWHVVESLENTVVTYRDCYAIPGGEVKFFTRQTSIYQWQIDVERGVLFKGKLPELA